MAKRTLFEEIASTEFRWPKPGDKPFVSDGSYLNNAEIAENDFTRLVLMTDGYKIAGDAMVQLAEKENNKRDYLVFPILFNYRHFIELSVKYQIAMFGPTVGVKPVWNTHDLVKLWSDFTDVLDRYGSEDPDNADPLVGEVVLEFAKIDPGSYSNRYPVDRKGNPIPLPLTEIHLPTLADVMTAVANYFKGCDGYLDNLKSAGP